MKAFKDFEKAKLSSVDSMEIVGGNSGGNTSEDVPITTLGTITNEGD